VSQFNFPHGQNSSNSQMGAQAKPNSIASSKLQKAIERNRIRQAKREGKTVDIPKRGTGYSQQEFTFQNKTTPRMASASQRAAARPQPRTTSTTTPRMGSTSTSRVSVATPNTETQFVRPKRTSSTIKKNTLKYPVKKTSTAKRKRIQKKKVKNAWIMKASWILLSFIVLRLVFAERGVLDYFAMQDLIQHKLNLIEETKVENQALVKEMQQIKTSSHHQKKLVREKLGFISGDEYLVIFSEDSDPASK
jgi:cell division protein FtsB